MISGTPLAAETHRQSGFHLNPPFQGQPLPRSATDTATAVLEGQSSGDRHVMGTSHAHLLPADFSTSRGYFASTANPTPPATRDYSHMSAMDHPSSHTPIQHIRCPHCSHLIRWGLVIEPIQPVHNTGHHSNEYRQWPGAAGVHSQQIPNREA